MNVISSVPSSIFLQSDWNASEGAKELGSNGYTRSTEFNIT
jgi:hypothetical protein